ncbi:MAG: efflux RND transporter periplasmic adaptor subunit [Geobacteraceae bacterium]|nr:efflux RND transporter periplasmic adaptor subunit [Geobacteraceae bacterium]NTW80667.1 efflux RND transporter periplasmic adaptor subunit [Geobacteraceae bacterium]
MSLETIAKLKIDKTAFHSGRGGKKRWAVLAAVLVLMAIAVVWGFERKVVRVETTTVVQVFPTQTFTLLNASGYVVAQRKAAVASKITGRLEWIGVQEGSYVKGGQIIARLENRDSDAAVNQSAAGVQNAKANVDQATAELADAGQFYGRQKELVKQGIISRAEFDAAESRYKRVSAAVAAAEASVRVAGASLQGARVAYDYSLIRAPFDAVVLTKNADVGDIITPLGAAANAKAAVVTIADLSSLQVEADVSESNLDKVKAGQPCEITLDALSQARFRGVLQTIVPTADRTKASVMVKVRFLDSDPRILPEMSAKVAILSRQATPQDQKPAVALNPAAITKVNGKDAVYLLDNGRVRLVPIKVGASLGELTEVSGVKPGDKVALRPLNKLKDNKKISVAEK